MKREREREEKRYREGVREGLSSTGSRWVIFFLSLITLTPLFPPLSLLHLKIYPRTLAQNV
jgi:hypothetical protein